jgi:DNA polymerase-1
MHKTAIIDGDMMAYRAAFASEVETKWTDDLWTLHSTESNLIKETSTFIKNIINKTKVDDVHIIFSPSGTFRHNLFPLYKANRKGKRKPMGLKFVREWTAKNYKTSVAENMEADDLCGILCTKHPRKYVAVSGDKDFNTLPITWFNHLRDEFIKNNKEDARRFHLIQTLAGDTVDGYAGCAGVGNITAKKFLDKEGYTWDSVIKLYEKKGQGEAEALVNAQLAYILQKDDYDFTTKTINLWTPYDKTKN